MSTKNRKSSNPAKTPIAAKKSGTAKSRKTPTPPAPTDSSTDVQSLVSVHDLTSRACIFLPEAMREILDEKEYQSLLTALDRRILSVIVRGPGNVIYLDLSIMVFEDNRALPSSQSEVTPPAQAKPTRKKAVRH